MRNTLFILLALPTFVLAKENISPTVLDEYFQSHKNSPNSFETDGKVLSIAMQILPENFEDFDKATYLRVLDQAWAKRTEHPKAVLNLISYIEDRRTRIYTRIVSEENQDHLMFSAAKGSITAVGTVASPYLADMATKRIPMIRASGTLMALNSRLQQQKWLKNPWLQASSAFIGIGAGMSYHYGANQLGWSIANLPPSPLEHLGFSTEEYTKFDKADSFNLLPKTIDTALFIPMSPLVLAASLGVSKMISKPFSCIPIFEKIGARIDKHPRVKSIMRFFNPVIWTSMGVSYLLLDSLTDKISDPLEELAYYKNYQRALQQLKETKDDPVQFEMAKNEFLLRILDLHKLLAAKLQNKISNDLRKILDENTDDKVAADKIQKYLEKTSWAMTESDLATSTWMKLIEADPANEIRVIADVLEKTGKMEITNSAHLFMHAAAVMKLYGQDPEIKSVNLVQEAFREWTLLEMSTISLKGEAK